jgi:hypothetical protein
MTYIIPIWLQQVIDAKNKFPIVEINNVPVFINDNQQPINFGPSIIDLYEVRNIVYNIPGPYQLPRF